MTTPAEKCQYGSFNGTKRLMSVRLTAPTKTKQDDGGLGEKRLWVGVAVIAIISLAVTTLQCSFARTARELAGGGIQ